MFHRSAALLTADTSIGLTGIPSSVAVHFVEKLVLACRLLVTNATSAPALAAVLQSATITSLLPHAVGRLARWQLPPLRVDDLLEEIHQFTVAIGLAVRTYQDCEARGIAEIGRAHV